MEISIGFPPVTTVVRPSPTFDIYTVETVQGSRRGEGYFLELESNAPASIDPERKGGEKSRRKVLSD